MYREVADECRFTKALERGHPGGIRSSSKRGIERPRPQLRRIRKRVRPVAEVPPSSDTTAASLSNPGAGSRENKRYRGARGSRGTRKRSSFGSKQKRTVGKSGEIIRLGGDTGAQGIIVGMRSVLRLLQRGKIRNVVICGRHVPDSYFSALETLCNYMPDVTLHKLVETWPEALGESLGIPQASVVGFTAKVRPELLAALSELEK